MFILRVACGGVFRSNRMDREGAFQTSTVIAGQTIVFQQTKGTPIAFPFGLQNRYRLEHALVLLMIFGVILAA